MPNVAYPGRVTRIRHHLQGSFEQTVVICYSYGPKQPKLPLLFVVDDAVSVAKIYPDLTGFNRGSLE
jgi:hypothetical protein